MTLTPMRWQGTTASRAGGELFGKLHQPDIQRIVEVEDVIDLLPGDDQRVAFGDGIDIQKGKKVSRFGYFVAGDFTRDDF